MKRITGRLTFHSPAVQKVGTCFLISKSCALTAFHLVGETRSGRLLEGTITVEFSGDKTTSAQCDTSFRDAKADWVLLRLDETIDFDEPLLFSSPPPIDEEWHAYGFPEIYADGLEIDGHITQVEELSIQLYCKQAAAGKGVFMNGMSGAACHCNGWIFGILRRVIKRKKQGTPGGVIWATPIAHIASSGVFDTLRIPFLRDRHRESENDLALLNESLDKAKIYLPSEDFGLKMKTYLPTEDFGLDVKGEEAVLSLDEFLVKCESGEEEFKKIVIQAAAGAGKSVLLRKIIASLKYSVPVFFNLKGWKEEWSDELAKPASGDPTRLRTLLLKKEITQSVGLEKIDQIRQKRPVLFLVDALNETWGSRGAQPIVETLQNAALMDNVRVIVTDRLATRAAMETGKWTFFRLLPVTDDAVETLVDNKFGSHTYRDLPKKSREILTIPYFLNLVLGDKWKSPRLASKAETLQMFLEGIVELTKDEIKLLEEPAYRMYELNHSTVFQETDFASSQSVSDLMEKLLHTGVVQASDERLKFSHQLVHDYLVSSYLARRGSNELSGKLFDIATLKNNSYETISMALSFFSDPFEGDNFLKSVYDWSWSATISSAAENHDVQPRPYSDVLKLIILAFDAEKLNDSMTKTRKAARDNLEFFPQSDLWVGLFGKVSDLPELTALVRKLSPSITQSITQTLIKEWFDEWLRIFLYEPPQVLSKNVIERVSSMDPVIGWTTANVIRRFGWKGEGWTDLADKSAVDVLTIIFRMAKEAENTPLSAWGRAVRWRVVHSLGVFPDEEYLELLFQALGDYEWVQYGAVRSLVEMAAITADHDLRKQILQRLEAALPTISPASLVEFAHAIFYSNAPNDWKGLVLPMLSNVIDWAEETVKPYWRTVKGNFEKEM